MKRSAKKFVFMISFMMLIGAEGCSGTVKESGPAYDISRDTRKSIAVDAISAQPYIKGGVRPLPVVKDGEKELSWGTDYQISYQDNDRVSAHGQRASVLITGTGNYTGTIAVPFDVTAGSLSSRSVAMIVEDIVYQNKNDICCPVLEVLDHGYPLEQGTDYEDEVTYTYKDTTTVGISGADALKTEKRASGEEVQKEDIIPPGTTLIATVTGKGAFAGSSRAAEFQILPVG